jgi:hypothetical protein
VRDKLREDEAIDWIGMCNSVVVHDIGPKRFYTRIALLMKHQILNDNMLTASQFDYLCHIYHVTYNAYKEFKETGI